MRRGIRHARVVGDLRSRRVDSLLTIPGTEMLKRPSTPRVSEATGTCTHETERLPPFSCMGETGRGDPARLLSTQRIHGLSGSDAHCRAEDNGQCAVEAGYYTLLWTVDPRCSLDPGASAPPKTEEAGGFAASSGLATKVG